MNRARPVPLRRGLVLALVIAIAAALPGTTTTSAQAIRPGPGIGENPGTPTGAPVALSLPPGYTLLDIRGGSSFTGPYCGDPSERAANLAYCAQLLGIFEATLVLRFDPAGYVRGRDRADDDCRRRDQSEEKEIRWGGWVLIPPSNDVQRLLIPIDVCVRPDGRTTPLVSLPAPSPDALAGGPTTVEVTLSGFCINLRGHVPSSDDHFTASVVTDDAGLVQIVEALRGKTLTDYGDQFEAQSAVWDYTDGETGLTADILNRIRALR